MSVAALGRTYIPWSMLSHTQAAARPPHGGVRWRRRCGRSAPLLAMSAARPLALSLAALLAALLVAQAARAAPDALARTRRQLADDNTLQPLDDAASDDQAREKRKLEGVTEAKFGIKNAVLGFVFGKINSLIDSKTRLVESLDRQNIEINKQYGIEAPKGGGLSSLSGIVGQVIGPKLQLLGPKIQAVTGLLGGASGGSGGSGGGSGLGSIISLVTSLSGSSSGGAAVGGTVETIDSSEEDDS
ncbi:uncharacterized protein LOC124539117 [Vanessa cardui]|uniref:uncharacterized protein LOC124539117 n=1 Tax=Vanessa cardui TaxID=171605 RepID=UPI001F12ABCE|nr:uncharacterized protein LOC124539117 [Vanessa cardui]